MEIKDGNESSDLDDEEEGGEWVTQENLYKYMANGEVVLNKTKEKNDEASESEEEQKEVIQAKSYIDFKEGSP